MLASVVLGLPHPLQQGLIYLKETLTAPLVARNIKNLKLIKGNEKLAEAHFLSSEKKRKLRRNWQPPGTTEGRFRWILQWGIQTNSTLCVNVQYPRRLPAQPEAPDVSLVWDPQSQHHHNGVGTIAHMKSQSDCSSQSLCSSWHYSLRAAPYCEHSCLCLKYVTLKPLFLLFLFSREKTVHP